MGSDYYIADCKARVFYALGRGNWWVLRDDLEAIQDLEYLTQYLLDECYHLHLQADKGYVKEVTSYVRDRVAPDLHHLFGRTELKDLRVFEDSGDDLCILRAKGYVCVGMSYGDKDTKEYKSDLVFYNRHLEAAESSRRYAPEEKHPDWEKY